MSLQRTLLPGFVLAQLFRSSLMEQSGKGNEEENTEPAAEMTNTPIVYQGKNLQEIVIGVHFTSQEQMPAEPFEFLVNILKACQRNTDHVAIVNFASGEYGMADVIAQLHPRIMLLFGSYPLFSSLTPDMADFVMAELQGIKIIRAPALEKLIQTTPEGRALKGKLWLLLKQLFNL